MSVVSDDTLALLAITNRIVDAGVPPLKASETWRLLDVIDRPSRLMGLDEPEVARAVEGSGIEPERLVRLLDRGIGLAVRLDALHDRGITALTALDAEYPTRLRTRLGAAAPPVLYCAGDASLLAHDGIGMVGSRDVGSEGAEVARMVAQHVARAGFAVVSGAAKGVDKVSMAAAYEAGGTVVGVLADSLERAVGVSETRAALLDGRSCLCTPYRPDGRFTTGTAMGRNKVIYGLSRVTLVVSSADGDGGTWSGATEAIEKRYGTVAVWMGDGGGAGNARLIRSGGIPIEQPEEIFDLAAVEPGSSTPPDQLTLDLGAARPPDE